MCARASQPGVTHSSVEQTPPEFGVASVEFSSFITIYMYLEYDFRASISLSTTNHELSIADLEQAKDFSKSVTLHSFYQVRGVWETLRKG